MKIELNGGYNIYRKSVAGDKSVKSGAANASKKASGTDVSEISRGNTAITQTGLASLKSKLQGDINLPASPERLNELRASIKGGSYRISTGDLVGSILGE